MGSRSHARPAKQVTVGGASRRYVEVEAPSVDPGAVVADPTAPPAGWSLSDDPPQTRHGVDEDGDRRGVPLHPALYRLLDAVRPGECRREPAPRREGRSRLATIAAVTEALEGLLNVAVARLHEFGETPSPMPNGAREREGLDGAEREAVKGVARLLCPMMPHLAENVRFTSDSRIVGRVLDLPWPEADASLVKAERLTVAVPGHG